MKIFIHRILALVYHLELNEHLLYCQHQSDLETSYMKGYLLSQSRVLHRNGQVLGYHFDFYLQLYLPF
jgi:hypothetical protein